MNTTALVQALSCLPRLSYNDWLKVLSGLAAEFGADTARQILDAAGFKDERRNETAYKLRKRLRNVTFGTVVFILKSHGIDTGEITAKTREYKPFERTPIAKPTEKLKPFQEPCIFSFADDVLEERCAIYQYQAGMTRTDAENRVIAENPNAVRERVYRVLVSEFAHNKKLLTDGETEGQQFGNFLRTFIPQNLALWQLIEVVRLGYAFIPCIFSGNKNQENWYGADLLCVDVDGTMPLETALGLPLTQMALFLYTTASHTEQAHRYRIVFALDGFERNACFYHALLQETIAVYHADTTGTDISKLYFGSTDARVWTPHEHWIY